MFLSKISIITCLVFIVQSSYSAPYREINRINVNAKNEEANDLSSPVISISDDGNFVAFTSKATNLVPISKDLRHDVFIRNISSNKIELVSVNRYGMDTNGGSSSPLLSADGNLILFLSDGSDMSESSPIGKGVSLYMRNLKEKQTQLISAYDPISSPRLFTGSLIQGVSMTGDGRYVLFNTDKRLSNNDQDRNKDYYLRDVNLKTTTLMSKKLLGGISDKPSLYAIISRDGKYIIYISKLRILPSVDDDNLIDIYRYKIANEEIQLISRGVNGGSFDQNVNNIGVSADGEKIVFSTKASNVISTTVEPFRQIYLYDAKDNSMELISKSANNDGGNADSYHPSITSSGNKIGYVTAATDIGESLKGNNIQGAVIYDSKTKLSSKIIRDINGDIGFSFAPAMSANADIVAFGSNDSGLVSNDTNNTTDIFVTERTEETCLATPKNGSKNFINILDEGAVGDGNNDDTASFQTSLEKLSVGGTLYIPNGKYRVNKELIINKRVVIKGDGESSQIFQESSNQSLFVFCYVLSPVIKDISLGSANIEESNAIIKLFQSHHSRISNVVLRGGGKGIWLAGSLLSYIENIKSDTNQGHFYAKTLTSPSKFWVYANRHRAISSNANTLVAPALEGGEVGVLLHDDSGQGSIHIFGGTIEGQSKDGVVIENTGQPSTITGTHFEAAKNGVSIRLVDAALTSIRGLLATDGISLEGRTRDTHISSVQGHHITIGNNVVRTRLESVVLGIKDEIGGGVNELSSETDTEYVNVTGVNSIKNRYGTIGMGKRNPDANPLGSPETQNLKIDVDGGIQANILQAEVFRFKTPLGKNSSELILDQNVIKVRPAPGVSPKKLVTQEDLDNLEIKLKNLIDSYH